jgi:hypothetical protein
VADTGTVVEVTEATADFGGEFPLPVRDACCPVSPVVGADDGGDLDGYLRTV